MRPINHQFTLAARPVGEVRPGDWKRTRAPVPALHAGEVLIRLACISLDPAMRRWMNAGKPSYVPAVGLGDVMRARAVGQVIESRNPEFAVGEHVSGMLGVQDYAISNGQGLSKVDAAVAPLSTYLNVLGMPGMTAYFGLLDIGRPKAGDTVVVSAAAGAVGSIVGQIARIQGARVVGIAGGADKCRYLVDELGFDAAIDYKADDVAIALARHAPDGVDVYFDNVGGDTLDAVLGQIRLGARIVICGAISQYNASAPVQGPSNYLQLLVHRATMTGMMVADYADRATQARSVMSGWMAEGRLKSREHVVEGLDTFPQAFDMLFSGGNHGKLVLRLASD